MTTFADLTVDLPMSDEAAWNNDGYLLLPRFMPDELIDAYVKEWRQAHANGSEDWADVVTPVGWPDSVAYMHHAALADLLTYGPLAVQLAALIGESAALHLTLTPWVSTTRNFHTDNYLNPEFVGDRYAAVWVALDDIRPESGPFQFVPGSHRWPVVTRQRMGEFFDLDDPDWPRYTEELLTPLYEEEIERRGAGITTYLPGRGSVLIWHPRLLHRGSVATVPGTERRAVIGHYSAVSSRPDMPAAVRRGDGWVFPLA